MQFSMGRFCVTVTITDNRKPWNVNRGRLADQVLAMVGENSHKIDRVKALREIAKASGWNNFTVWDAIEWVEAAYAQNGSGVIL